MSVSEQRLEAQAPQEPGGPDGPLVEVSDVSRQFGSAYALRDVDFTIDKGEVVVILGPSGSGKSTLLRMINLLEHPDTGFIRIDGRLIGQRETPKGYLRVSERLMSRQRRMTGMVFQQFHLFPHLTVSENVSLAPINVGGVAKSEAEQKAKKLLARVGLAEFAQRYPSELSGGQQQRVAIARSLAMDPKVMLFDEPTSALDPEMVKEVLDVILDLRHDGMTMALVSHEIGFARAAADRVVFMDEGQIVETGKPDTFFVSPQTSRAQDFLAKVL
jgi:ABC-type polar amino acid transport system, ATPase component